MIERKAILEAARECLGTPWNHQGRIVGLRLDCIGVLVHTARRIGVLAPDEDIVGYSRTPDGWRLLHELQARLKMKTLQEAQPGDVVAMIDRLVPRVCHVGILTDLHQPFGLLHAYAQARKCVEMRLDEDWTYRIRGTFAFPGVE